MGLIDPAQEIITSTATRHHVMRALLSHADVFLLAVLDRHHANMSTVRSKLDEVERNLS